jgi:hypothetical protein
MLRAPNGMGGGRPWERCAVIAFGFEVGREAIETNDYSRFDVLAVNWVLADK